MTSINSFRSVETVLLSRAFRPFLMESLYGAFVGRSIDREGCAIFSAVGKAEPGRIFPSRACIILFGPAHSPRKAICLSVLGLLSLAGHMYVVASS